VGLVKLKCKCSPCSLFIANMMNVEINTTIPQFLVFPGALIFQPQIQGVEGESDAKPSWRWLRRLHDRW
jgi:hypothetical protein